MKKCIVSFMAIFMFVQSCDKEDPMVKRDYSKATGVLNEIFSGGFKSQMVNLRHYVAKGKKGQITVDYASLTRHTMTELNSKYFGIENFDYSSVINSIESAMNANNSMRQKDDISDLSQVFSTTQLEFLSEYFEKMYNIDNLEDAQNISAEVKDKIFASSISEEHKQAVLALIECGGVIAEFVYKGDYSDLIDALSDDTQLEGGKQARCSVGWREVWGGAVVGLTSGAVRGAIVGGAGGTVAFPGVGTVTGALSGAVFGGASGFLYGAASGVAASLLLTCFR